MSNLAAAIGRFVGAVLAECGPEIVRILRAAFRNTMEDGQLDDDLRAKLLGQLRDKDDLRPGGLSGETPRDDSGG